MRPSAGGDDQDLGDVPVRVLLPVRDQGDLLHGDPGLSLGGGLSRDPDAQLALVGAALPVDHAGDDPMDAALARPERARDRILPGADVAGFRGFDDLLPPVPDSPPTQALGAQGDRASGHGLAVEVGDDRLDPQRLTALDEGPRSPEAHVQRRGVDEQVRRGRPSLPVHVLDAHADGHRGGPGNRRTLEVDAKAMLALAVCARVVVLRHPGGFALHGRSPPWCPGPEREVAAVRGCVGGGVRRHRPGRLRVGKASTRKVLGEDSHVGVASHEKRPLAGVGRDLELGPPELLDLEPVVMLSTLGLELHRCGPEVHGRGQGHAEVKAPEGADPCRSFRDGVPLRVLHLVGDFLDPGGRAHVAGGTWVDPPDPALGANLLTWTIKTPVVGDVEPQGARIRSGLPIPRPAPPGRRGLRQEREVVPAPGHENRGR
jgi:hypothetical protein